jgi:hypothetical protein
MKMLTAQPRLVSLLSLFVFLWTAAHAQLTPLGDSYINTASPTTNYGSKTLLDVDGASQTTYIQFNLGSIPATASVSQATLKLYVNSVTTAGSFNVDYVSGAWSEGTIDASNAPPLGAAIASNISVTTAGKNQYILIDVTSAVQAWLNGSEANNGLALVANSSFNATFDSKENTMTSHPAELDIAFAGGDGTITGVTTASGSGLTGGGTSGTLNLSLLTSCASNQVLQWNGSAWACANAATGTITGVTAGTDLTGGGTSGNVTLNLNTSALNSSYAQLAAANTFTGNQTVNGNLSATGLVTGSGFQIGSNLFDYGSYANQNAFLGFAGNTTMTGTGNAASGFQALLYNTTGTDNTASGFQALYSNTTGGGNTASGYGALYSNTTGTYGTASGFAALVNNTTGFGNTASGFQALVNNTTGGNNTASGFQALQGNTTGAGNTASGSSTLWYSNGNNNTATGTGALHYNSTGNNNTGVGFEAGSMVDGSTMTANNNTFLGASTSMSTGNLTNATAIGANAEVAESNALVLGSVNGVNGATANTNVGIGTTAPLVTLHLDLLDNGGAGASDSLLMGNPVTRGLELSDGQFGVGNGPGMNISSFGVPLFINYSGQNTVINGNGGKVGIGITTPSNLLSLVPGGGPAIADGWSTYSSRRWKTNIQTLPDALAKVEKLRGVSYDLKASGKHEIGVIAEEVGDVVPEVVSYEENGKDARGVDYSRLTALLIEAVKQQQRVVKQQQREISGLRGQLQKRAAKEAALESRVEQLERQRGETQLASAHPVR